jgi:hypothetical protein
MRAVLAPPGVLTGSATTIPGRRPTDAIPVIRSITGDHGKTHNTDGVIQLAAIHLRM